MVVNQILCVAEKPSISKSVAQILSGGQLETKSTKNQYIKNYQFNCMYEGRQSQVTMTALLGHLMEYEFPPEYKQWNNSSTPQLFEATLLKRVKSNMQDLADNLKRQSRYCQLLVIWTDCDREGENIGAEVVGICQSVNPNIIVKRARFSVVQHRDIQTAWNSLVNLDMNAAKAVDARSELDLRIGAVFTRFQTVNLKPKFQDLADQKVLSYGPCQFPTLGFVVDRFLKAKHFVEEPFWKIDLTVSKDGIDTKFHWDRAHLFDHHMTLVLYEMCIDASVGVIKKVTSKPKSKWAPLPLTTVELQKIGSRTLRISSDKIMHIAEALYNQGIISYPRTETDSFSPTFDLKSLIEKQVNDPNWGQYAKGLLDGKFRFPRKGKRDDQAHPPIHPVRGALTLQGDERKVYDFVTRRFLACCSDSAKGNETIVDLTMADESFTAKGLMIIERNFLDVYPFEKWSDSQVGVFTEGETVEPSILEMNEGSTNKPNMLTEADLINIMDKSGIGTDSTIHEHIKKILEREYANKEGDYFFPTTLGMALVCGYDSMNIELSLSKPDLRALMEQNMKYICEGRKTKESVLREVIDMYKSAFDTAQAQMDVLVAECNKFMTPIPFQQQADATTRQGVYVRHCPKCKMQMLLKSIKGNDAKKMIGCTGYPSCRESVWMPDFVTDVSVHENICGTCSEQNQPAHLVTIQFRRASLPYTFPLPLITCLWCNREFLEYTSPRKSNQPDQQTFNSVQIPVYNSRSNHASIPMDNFPNHNISGDGQDICHCKTAAVTRVVRKEGPNCGRQFYVCAKAQSDTSRCEYFKWADEQSSESRQQSGTASNSNYHGSNSGDSNINCKCNLGALSRTVRKEGPNCGRQFYVCGKSSSDDKCDFFAWAGDGANTFEKLNTTNTSGYQAQTANNFSKRTKCQCDLVAIVKTCHKAGPNQNRNFLSCPKSGATCKFFEWVTEDEMDSNTKCYDCGQFGHFTSSCPTNRTTKESTQTRGSSSSSTSTCYGCGQVGHFASTCPQRQTNRAGPSDTKCYKCGQKGHMANACPNK